MTGRSDERDGSGGLPRRDFLRAAGVTLGGVAVGEHPDPFVLDEQLEEQLARDYPLVTHKPWLDVKL